jgi:hypothetical protein
LQQSRAAAQEWLAQLYAAWGKPDEAAKWKELAKDRRYAQNRRSAGDYGMGAFFPEE